MHTKSEYLQKIKNKVVYRKLYRRNYKPKFFDSFSDVKKVISSGNWNIAPYPGKYNLKFTKSFLEMHKAKYGLCLSNGTVAISVALKAAKIKYGDEILISSVTYHTTASAALELGIKPIFLDIDANTLCIDINKIKNKINKKTKALVLVHLGSMISNIDQIVKICKKEKIILIEDCSHVHGSRWNNKGVGTFGDFGTFSFQQSKLITSGEGGFLITKNKKNYYKCLSLINCGRNYSNKFEILGVNHRLTEIQGALLLFKLRKFKKNLIQINSNINYFTNELKKFKEFEVLKFDKKHNFKTGYFYGFKLSDFFLKKKNKNNFLKECEKMNLILQKDLYKPVYLTPEFGWKNSPMKVNYKKTKCKVAETILPKKVVWLNFIYFLGDQNFLDDILGTFKIVFKRLNSSS